MRSSTIKYSRLPTNFSISRPKCDATDDAMKSQVRIAYYNAEGAKRKCDAVQPENIPAGVLTHINVAFEGINSDLEITDTIGETVARVSRLKKIYPGLRVNIAIGGWVFNDPPTEHRFSDMAATYTSQRKFISSLIKYMQKYALDGVDIDWEYPVADDRGMATLVNPTNSFQNTVADEIYRRKPQRYAKLCDFHGPIERHV